jgi:hypothetical protein
VAGTDRRQKFLKSWWLIVSYYYKYWLGYVR